VAAPLPALPVVPVADSPPAGAGGAPEPHRPVASLPEEPTADTGDRLVTGGLVAAGVGYGLSALGATAGLAAAASMEADGEGTCADSLGYGYIPVAGPILVGAFWPNHIKHYDSGQSARCSDYTTAVSVAVAADAALQIGGLVTALVGLAWERDRSAARTQPLQIGVLPTVGAKHGGLSLFVRGF
jgi:hypothetical protein